MIDNYRYDSNYTDRPGRARPTPRHGWAAGRRHADHPEARRRLYQRQHPTGLRSARCGAWTPGAGTAPVDDASLAVYLGELFEAGRAPATAALAVAAVRFRAKLAGQPAPRRGSDRPRVRRLPSHGRRPGPGIKRGTPPTCGI